MKNRVLDFIESYRNYKKRLGWYTNEELWNLKYSIASFVAPRLQAFRNAVKKGNNMGYPQSIVNDTDYDHIEDLNERWSTILDDMLFIFLHYSGEIDEKISIEEKTNKKEKSLKLFAKHYENLWD